MDYGQGALVQMTRLSSPRTEFYRMFNLATGYGFKTHSRRLGSEPFSPAPSESNHGSIAQ